MENPLLIAIHKVSMGVMATIQFPTGKVPKIGDIVILEGISYKIAGVVFSVNPITQGDRLDNNIHDCRIEKL
ncbi:hypothetical protein [Chitinophaga dinghuensis]|nr:hypothetical protein [Chitinophaga dinghuensis]